MHEERQEEDPVAHVVVDGLLREFARAGTDADEAFIRQVMDKVRGEATSSRRLIFQSVWLRTGLAAAACLVIALGVWIVTPVRVPRAIAVGQIMSVQGTVTVEATSGAVSAVAGADLTDGARIVGRSADMNAVIRLSDGTAVEVRGMVDLRFSHPASGFSLRLARGFMAADVVPQAAGKHLSVASPHGTATVLGTRLNLDVSDAFTRLAVESGKVRFVRASDGKAVEVGAGQFVQSSLPDLKAQSLGAKSAVAEPLSAQPWDQPPAGERPPIPAGHTIVDVETVTQLEAAVAALRDHTTIRLQAGTYPLRKGLVIDKVVDVAIRGASDRFEDVAVLGNNIDGADGVVNLLDIRSARKVLMADMMLGNARNHAVQLHGEMGTEDVRIFHCRLSDCEEALLKTSAGANGGVVEYSVFELTRFDPATGGDSGIKVLGGTNWVVKRSLFRNFAAPVPSANAFKFHPAVAFRDGSAGTVVEHCTFLNCDHSIGFGRSANGDHVGGRVSDNIVVHQRDLFDGAVVGPYGASQRDSADAPITVWGSAGTEIARNTVLCNGNFRGAIYVRWPATGVAIRGNRTDSRILVADGAAPLLENNRQDAGADLFVRLDPTAPRRFGPRDADGRLTFAKTPGMDLRLRERVETVRLEERAK